MRRLVPGLVLLASSNALAASPAIVPVTGYLTDSAGVPLDGPVDIDAALYRATGPAIFSELQTVDVDQGQFTFYLNADEQDPGFLALFRDNGSLFLGLSIESGPEMTPRFEIGTAPYASWAQYCDDAATLGGSAATDYVTVNDPIAWSSLSGVPATLLDGDADTTYAAGTGLLLSGTTFSLAQPAVEGIVRATAYDTESELTALLDDDYLPNLTCPADNVLYSDGTAWGCEPLDIPALEADVAALKNDVAALQNAGGSTIVEYELDENAGAITFTDSSGLGNNAVAGLGSVVAGSSVAHSTRSVAFSGSQGLMVPAPNQIPSTAQVQAELWLRTGDVTLPATLIEKNGAWRLRLAGSRAEWTVTTVGGPCTITHSTALVNNAWTHVSAWANGLNATVSVNGVTQTIGCTTGPIVSSPGSALTVGGHFASTWSEVLNGNIDEVRVRPTAPLGTRASGSVVNVTTFVSGTRRVLADAASITMETFNVTKRSPTSYLLIDGSISGWGNYSGDMTQGFRCGTAPEVVAQGLMYDNTAYTRLFPTKVMINNCVGTGAQSIVFRYFAANGGAGNRPFITYNPNGSDEGRLAQTQSVYTVWEIEP